MTRILASLAIAAALAAAPLALTVSTAEAGAKGTKICKHKTQSGKVKTWRCRKDQPCCSAEWINYYTCGSKLLGCL
jgi:hypothetical protein